MNRQESMVQRSVGLARGESEQQEKARSDGSSGEVLKYEKQ